MIRTGLLALSLIASLSAATVTYTDRSTWLSNVTLLSNYNGGAGAGSPGIGAGVPGTVDTFGSGGIILTDLQINGFSGVGNAVLRVTPDSNPSVGPWYQFGSGSFLRSLDKTGATPTYLRVTFSAPVNSFGFNFAAGGSHNGGVTYGGPGSMTLAPQGLSTTTVTTTGIPTWNFYGVTSDTQTFSYVDIIINDTNRWVALDDIARGNFSVSEPPPAETLEPGTLLQLGIGGLMLVVARRRFGWA